MVMIFAIDFLLGGLLKGYGVRPRDIDNVYTIMTAPWLHGNASHLLSNLSAFIVLSYISLLQGVRYYFKASAIIIILGGALLWIFGRDATHIGASGWIFGLWALLIARAWLDRSLFNIIIGLAVLFFYGSMALGLLPLQSHVSFESHIFGAIAGIFAATFLKRDIKTLPHASPNNKRSKYDTKFGA